MTLNISGPPVPVAKSGTADDAEVVAPEATDAAKPVAANESPPICALAVPTDIAPAADPFVSDHSTTRCAFEQVAVPCTVATSAHAGAANATTIDTVRPAMTATRTTEMRATQTTRFTPTPPIP